jgi:hypothetical protein
LLIDEFIQYTEKAEFIYTVLTANPETFPATGLEGYTQMMLA